MRRPNFSFQNLKKFRFDNCKPPADGGCPIIAHLGINPSRQLESTNLYRAAIGSLSWLAINVRFDIAYAVNQCAQWSHKPTTEAWKAVGRIFKYLAGKKDLRLVFKKQNQPIYNASCDADWAGGATGYSVGAIFISLEIV